MGTQSSCRACHDLASLTPLRLHLVVLLSPLAEMKQLEKEAKEEMKKLKEEAAAAEAAKKAGAE